LTRIRDSHPRAAEKASPSSLAGQVLANAQSGREVVQDFCPLAESLEMELGKEYLFQRGNKAFISDAPTSVPYIINNDGNLSRNAAEVLFESLERSGEWRVTSGEKKEDIVVLELGIGLGLFARYFLDHFRDLCLNQRRDYYDRLCYIAADRSGRMLLDVARHGILANHPGRYRLRIVDAIEPETVLTDIAFVGSGQCSVGSGQQSRKPVFHAVFLNYLLDCLPAAVLEFEKPAPDTNDEAVLTPHVKQLCVRTCVGRNVRLADYTDMTLEQLQERAKIVASGRCSVDSQQARKELLEVYGLFASEYDYRPVDLNIIPFGKFGYEYAHRWSKRLLLSYGAIDCLEKLLGMVRDDGFILINDYGQTQVTDEDEFEHQRFSMATFVGLNFPLLKAYFEGREAKSQGQDAPENGLEIRSTEADQSSLATRHSSLATTWVEPLKEAGGIHSRLLGRRIGPELRDKFQRIFGEAAQEELHKPALMARQCLRVGRFELAATYYNKALEQQPRNWVLQNEIAMFLIFQLRDVKAGIDMAKLALGLNPTCSAELWNTLGDGLYEYGRNAEARSAYLKALEVNDSDVRARYNLAWVYARDKNFPDALAVLAEALAFAGECTGGHRHGRSDVQLRGPAAARGDRPVSARPEEADALSTEHGGRRRARGRVGRGSIRPRPAREEQGQMAGGGAPGRFLPARQARGLEPHWQCPRQVD
jgi:tetratricopeptide (TPR) repeat protein